MKNKPRIRFKGFAEDWEQHKLGDLYKRVNERNDGTLGRDKWISVAKMYFQDPDKVQSNNLDTRTYVMKKGDIAFEGHPNNEFRFGRFVLNDIGTGIISELFPIYRPITEYDLDFWKYAIQLERVMAPIFAKSITSSGNSSNKLDHNHFLNQELLVPNIEEQKKIGTLLSILSKNITLHQRKLEKLKLAKKALLQKLFPKNGSQFPEIRFKGFTDAWEQRELSSLTEYIGTGKSQFAIKEFGEYAILGSTNVIGYDDAYDYDGNFILTARVGANAGQLYQYSGKVKITDNTVFLMSDRSQFIYYTLTHFDLRRLSFGTGQPLVKSSELQKLKLCVPVSKSEQEKIGEIFNNIDNIITLHQRKLDKLQEVKKGLLQKMFV